MYELLGTDIHLFWNVSVKEPQKNLYHFMVLGCLVAPPNGRIQYTWGKHQTQEERWFAALRKVITKSPLMDTRQNAWISDNVWRITDMRVSVRGCPQ